LSARPAGACHLPEGSAPSQEAGCEGQGIGVGSRRRSAPLTLYFDTSALIKLVVQEEGSELAAQLWSTRHPAAASIVAYPEGRAALALARRAGRLTPTGYRTALEHWEATHGELHVIAIDDRLARHAGELAEKLSLRGYDAVHLASSLALGPDTTVITWDLEFNRAAHVSGLAVAPAP